jgi:hypothetical protein
MKQSTRWTALLLATAFVGLLLASCMGQPPEEMSVEELLEKGKYWLQEGEGSVAYGFFAEALDKEPENLEAHYGIVLALDKRVFANIDGIIDLLTGVYVFYPQREECEKSCARLEECQLLDEAWTTKEDCVQDCPFGLQPYMFDTTVDGSTCQKIRDIGLEWIIPTTPENCEALCNDLELCGLIKPPVTFTVEECIAECPYAYVEHHSKCYLSHLGECNGHDRTCFDHTTVGLQILFREIGVFVPPQVIEYTDFILASESTYQYDLRKYNWTLFSPPIEIDWSGRYDYGFMYLSRALASSFHALLMFCTSVMLEMNFQSFDLNLNYGAPQGVVEILEAANHLLKVWLYDPIFPNAFLVLDEDYAKPQLLEGGLDLGYMFQDFANLVDFMENNRDLQRGLALGYDDANHNFFWDEDETVTIRGFDLLGKDLELTREQMFAVRDLSRELEANLLERVPFVVDHLKLVFEAFGLEALDWVVDLLSAWTDNGTIDPSELFYNPQRTSFRELLATVVIKIDVIVELLKEMGVE